MHNSIYEITHYLGTYLILLVIMVMFAFMYVFFIHDIKLQRAQHDVTYKASNLSREQGITGNGGTLRYGEPYMVEVSEGVPFLFSNIQLREARSGVNRGKFTEKGYVYK